MTEAIPITGIKSSKKKLQKLYEEQNLLKTEKKKCEHAMGAILDSFITRKALKWPREKKRLKLELLNKAILQYNHVRKQLRELHKKIRALEEQG